MVIAVAGLKKHWTAVPSRRQLESLKDAKEIDMIWHLGDIGYIDDAFAHDPVKFMCALPPVPPRQRALRRRAGMAICTDCGRPGLCSLAALYFALADASAGTRMPTTAT